MKAHNMNVERNLSLHQVIETAPIIWTDACHNLFMDRAKLNYHHSVFVRLYPNKFNLIFDLTSVYANIYSRLDEE